jgi:hypothetical protein
MRKSLLIGTQVVNPAPTCRPYAAYLPMSYWNPRTLVTGALVLSELNCRRPAAELATRFRPIGYNVCMTVIVFDEVVAD